MLERYGFLVDYNFDEVMIKQGRATPRKKNKTQISIVKRLHTQKPSSARDLANCLKNPHTHLNQKYVFEGRIQNISDTNPNSFLKVYDLNQKTVSKFSFR